MGESDKRYYLCVTPFFPDPAVWRGAYVLDQAKAIMRHSGYEVVVFRTYGLRERCEDYEVDGIKVHAIKPPLMPSYFLNGATERLAGDMFARKLEKCDIPIDKIDYVHCHTISHAAFGFGVRRRNGNAKVIVQFHDLDPLSLRNGFWADKKWNRRYRARKSLSAINRADLLLCISEPVRDALLSFPEPRQGEVYGPALRMLGDVGDMPHVRPAAVRVLNNGVDTSIFKPAAKVGHGNAYRIGCIANFEELKDHMTLVKAFKELIGRGHTDMRLSMLGSGPAKDGIVRYLSDNGLMQYCEWPAEMRHEQLNEYYNTLDLFALPSIYEGFGCVYLEAAACGVPFICCRHQGAAECIPEQERERWLIEPGNHMQLADAIERQYLSPREQRLGRPIDIDVLISDYLKSLEAL